jgi:hypothetical protein
MTTSGNVILREREMISSGYILVKWHYGIAEGGEGKVIGNR